MKEREKAHPRVATAPRDMTVYRTCGVYQKLLLCEYLRELPEYPVTEAEETAKETSLFPSRRLPVNR
jgi:hypothetical protein